MIRSAALVVFLAGTAVPCAGEPGESVRNQDKAMNDTVMETIAR